MNIVVLCGGTSTERDISIKTGNMVCEALRSKGHNAIVVDIYCGNKEIDMEAPFAENYDLDTEIAKIKACTGKLDDFAKEKAENGVGFFGDNVIELCKMSDIVFMALHGANGEDGKVQAVFDLYDIRYTGTGAIGSAMAMDKGITKEIFRANNVPTPNGIMLHKGDDTSLSLYGMKLPCVVKPCCGGSSVGVTIANTDEEYEKGLNEAFRYEDEIIVEEYVKGREFSVGVIAGKALPIIEIVPKEGFYDYTNKYVPGKTEDICPAVLSDEITKRMQEAAVLGSKVLRLGSYSRLDFLLDENDNIYCLEANTLPGMTATSLLPQEALVIGYTFPDLCELLIEESKKRAD